MSLGPVPQDDTTRYLCAAAHIDRRYERPFAAQRQMLALSPPWFVRQLERYRMPMPWPDGGAPLIVHRGYNPFVGAGLHREPWSMALPLERLTRETKPDGSPFEALTTVLLYERGARGDVGPAGEHRAVAGQTPARYEDHRRGVRVLVGTDRSPAGPDVRLLSVQCGLPAEPGAAADRSSRSCWGG